MKRATDSPAQPGSYSSIHGDIVVLLESAHRAAARSVNTLMTATYWEIGRRIVELEQGGDERASYGQALLKRLAADLTARFGRGFGVVNLQQMRNFYRCWPAERICQTVSDKFTTGWISQTPSAKAAVFDLPVLASAFPLSWSAYVRLLSVRNEQARVFYEAEALRNGWSVRQLDRQIGSQYYERTALSRNKAAMIEKSAAAEPDDLVTPEQALKDPFVLEFLNLKDEYSESDLLFFHRRLKCLLVIDLKAAKFSYADAGQMHMYLNYAREHWMKPGENPPVGLILCAGKGASEARYALDGLPNKIMATEYQTALPDANMLAADNGEDSAGAGRTR